MFSSGHSLCVCGYRIQMLYLLPTTLHTFLSDTSAHWNKHKCLPHNSSLLCPLSLFLPLPLPLRHRNLPQALHLSGLSACFFIWLVATGGSTLADYNSAASHFRFIRAPASPPHTPCLLLHFSLPHLSLPYSLPSPASVQTTQQFLITPLPYKPPHSPLASHLPYLPLRSAQKI